MPLKPPPPYRPNNALPILPKMAPAVYRPLIEQLHPAKPLPPAAYQPAMSTALLSSRRGAPHGAPLVPSAPISRLDSSAPHSTQTLATKFSAASLPLAGVVRLTQPTTIQSKKGTQGGKGGLGYGDVGGGNQEVNRIALERAGLNKGIKGHIKGNRGSGISGQTEKETEKFVEKRKEVRTEIKAKMKICRSFHKRDNLGATCPGCGQDVKKSMI